MNKETKITLLSILAAILLIALLFVLLYRPIKKRYHYKNFKECVGNSLYKIALHNDYYLINQLVLKIDSLGKQNMHIDHLLFGEKYIYLIADRAFQYPVDGNENDNAWKLNKKGKIKLIDNPLIMNNQRANKLSTISSIPLEYLISVVVINDESLANEINTDNENHCVTRLSNLSKVIVDYESKNVSKLNDSQVALAVKDIAMLNNK